MFGNKKKSIPKLIAELKQLTLDYAKQETIDPIKGLGRYLGLGCGGSLLMGIGLVLWILALLRALQNETGTMFTDHLSWVPYLITLVVTVVIILITASAIGKDQRRADKKKQEMLDARKDAS